MAPSQDTPLPSGLPYPMPLTCISSVMATKSATEMWGPVRKSWSFRNLSSSTCRHLSSSVSVDANVSGGTCSPRNTGNIIWWVGRQREGSGSAQSPARSCCHPIYHQVFKLLLTPTHSFHPWPPPAQASSPTPAWTASTSPYILMQGSQGRTSAIPVFP